MQAWLTSLGKGATNFRQGTVEDAQRFTGNWIIETQEYREWRENKHPDVLWLTGKAGSGKSTLMPKMLKEMQRMTKQPDLSSLWKKNTDEILIMRTTPHNQAQRTNDSAIVASYFYHYKDEFDHVRMLQSLLVQILKQDQGLFPAYYETRRDLSFEDTASPLSCKESVEPPTTWSFSYLLGIFKALLNFQKYPVRELFVDAVDESQETLEVVQLFQDLASQNTGTSTTIIKAVVAYRPTRDLSYRQNEHRIAVEEHNTGDIVRVINTGVKQISNGLSKFSEKEQALYDLTLFQNELIKRANGVVLWITVVFKLVEHKLKVNQLAPADLIKMLDHLPHSVIEMYERVVEQLLRQSPQEVVETQHRLNWALLQGGCCTSKSSSMPLHLHDWVELPQRMTRHATAFLTAQLKRFGLL